LRWESEELQLAKAELDELERKNAKPKSLAMRIMRGELSDVSDAAKPALKKPDDAWLFG
jgi:hypothetical protein